MEFLIVRCMKVWGTKGVSMNKKEVIKLFELNGFLAGYRDNHKRRMQLADSTVEYNLHKGAYLAYDNALTQLENLFGEK